MNKVNTTNMSHYKFIESNKLLPVLAIFRPPESYSVYYTILLISVNNSQKL